MKLLQIFVFILAVPSVVYCQHVADKNSTSTSASPENRTSPNLGLAFCSFVTHTNFLYFSSGMHHVNFGGGVFFEHFSRKKPGISFFHEISYRKVKGSGTGLFYEHLRYESQHAKMTQAIRLSYPLKSGSRFFVGAGIGYGFRVNMVTDSPYEYIYGRDRATSNFELGPLIQAGKSFIVAGRPRLIIELRYELEKGVSADTNFKDAQNLGINCHAKLN